MVCWYYMPGRSVALVCLSFAQEDEYCMFIMLHAGHANINIIAGLDCDEVQDWKTESRLHISLTKTKNPGIFTYYKTTKLNTHKEKEKIIIDYFIDIL